ncbi:MAG: hypothetical protein RL701_1363 [Pseudomonadota bacterium]|jgi:hypothetical protein
MLAQKSMRAASFVPNAVVILIALSACGDPEPVSQRLPSDPQGLCTTCGDCEEHFEVLTARHVQGPVDYPDVPPVGGPHSGCWGTWGVHDTELKTERWVHNLEHGGVVLLYNCENCAADIAKLAAFSSTHERTLVTPYAALPRRFAAVAWEYRLVTECLDLQAFETFYATRFDHGPESIEQAPDPLCAERPEL